MKPSDTNSISLILSIYNEAPALPLIFNELRSLITSLKNLEIIFVNNGSTDETSRLIDEFIQQNLGLCKKISFETQGTFTRGILAGFKEAKGDVISWTHTDGQTPLIDIFRAMNYLEKDTIVKGKRINKSRNNKFISKVLDLFSSFVLQVEFNEIYAQPKVFHRKDFEADLLSAKDDVEIDFYLLYLARRKKIKIQEIEVYFKERFSGKSKVQGTLFSKLKFIHRNIKMILKIKFIMLVLFSQSILASPHVLLISLDGYRWDYTEKYKPPFITEFMKKGVAAKSLRPSFPADTFPNHLTIVTGQHPDNHGIVANSFYSPELDKIYALPDKESQKDGRFYKSKTFWGLVSENKMKSAIMFWPGSEAEILGKRPDYYHTFNPQKTHDERINNVVSWLKLPEADRPQFIALYFEDVDTAGHFYGPESNEVKEAVKKVDKTLEKLYLEVKKLKLDINIMIVSDHGMTSIKPDQYEKLSKSKELDQKLNDLFIMQQGGHLHIYNKTRSAINLSRLRDEINKGATHFKCYLQGEAPKNLNYGNNPAEGDIFCLAKMGWRIFLTEPKKSKGGHGWSPDEGMDMHGIFYAQGPALKENHQSQTLRSIHLFPLMAHILNLKFDHKIDGNLEDIKDVLK